MCIWFNCKLINLSLQYVIILMVTNTRWKHSKDKILYNHFSIHLVRSILKLFLKVIFTAGDNISILTNGITDAAKKACLCLATCCEQIHDASEYKCVFLSSVGYTAHHLRSKIGARWKMMRVFRAITADPCVFVFGAELTGTPKWPRLRRKPRAGAGTVAAGCRMDRKSLGFIWSNSKSKDCAVPCSIIDALKRKNILLIKF